MPKIIIIGAGLAGLTAAIELSRQGYEVVVLEKKELPRHKVCGEYLSYEVMPFLKEMQIDIPERPMINRFILSTASGNSIECNLPLGGIGISRKTLDLALYKKAVSLGAEIKFNDKVREVKYLNGQFELTTSKGEQYQADQVIAAFGKGAGWMSYSDMQQEGRLVQLGVKQYFEHPMADDLVVLHNFKGGYCGAVKVEDGSVDVAYMVRQDIFSQYKSPERLEKALLHANPFLKDILVNGTEILDKPLTVSNFQLGNKALVKDHVLYAGDAAAMIPPASGNGMAMAIWGGRLVAGSCHLYFQNGLERSELERHYQSAWQKKMRRRLIWGQQFQKLMGSTWPAEAAMGVLKTFPAILPKLISLTHD